MEKSYSEIQQLSKAILEKFGPKATKKEIASALETVIETELSDEFLDQEIRLLTKTLRGEQIYIDNSRTDVRRATDFLYALQKQLIQSGGSLEFTNVLQQRMNTLELN
jgi:hypothetical protein